MRTILVIAAIFHVFFAEGDENTTNIRLHDDSFSSSCDIEDVITSSDVEDLQEQLEQTLENLLKLGHADVNIDITVIDNNEQQTKPVEKFQYTTTNTHAPPTVSEATIYDKAGVTTVITETTPENAAFLNRSCDIQFGETCYWGKVFDEKLDFAEASDYCEDRNSIVATFPNEEVFDNITDYLHYMVPNGGTLSDHANFWLGLEINPINYDPPQNVFIRWFNKFESPPYKIAGWTNVVVTVYRLGMTESSMINANPDYRRHGVICSYPEHI